MRHPSNSLRALLISALFLVFASRILAQQAELDKLAARVAQDLSNAPHKERKLKIAVFVFQDVSGAISPSYALLSDAFAASLARQSTEFEFLDKASITKMGKSVDLSDKEIADEDVAHYLAQETGAAVLITGTVEKIGETVKVSLRATNTEDYKLLSVGETTFPALKDWLDLASLPAVSVPTDISHTSSALLDLTPPTNSGKESIGEPECTYCPPPRFSKAARAAKLEGIVLLKLTVSAEGLAQNIRVMKPLDQGLTERAILAVKNWKFKPAKQRDGKAVPVEVLIEVTFRQLR